MSSLIPEEHTPCCLFRTEIQLHFLKIKLQNLSITVIPFPTSLGKQQQMAQALDLHTHTGAPEEAAAVTRRANQWMDSASPRLCLSNAARRSECTRVHLEADLPGTLETALCDGAAG